MPMTFPNAPSEGQLHTTGGVQYQYSNGRWRTYPQQYEPVGAVATHEAAADPHIVYGVSSPNSTAVTYNAGGTTTIALDGGRTEVFTATAVTGPTTWAITGLVVGKVTSALLVLTNGGSQTQIWPAGATFVGGIAPQLTSLGKDKVLLLWDGAELSIVVLEDVK